MESTHVKRLLALQSITNVSLNEDGDSRYKTNALFKVKEHDFSSIYLTKPNSMLYSGEQLEDSRKRQCHQGLIV